ncbi:hypothetical protein [Peribacillus simplex]|uniref:hypothetical protein n=1 Tax=Peribacillus simplex TaxID=1478 RepID=UPI000BA60E63|nr:hypothetical protein [Peribacillus simplex]PAK38906.1 hypothetical protein CHI08_19725 [Peribacillus simplex]
MNNIKIYAKYKKVKGCILVKKMKETFKMTQKQQYQQAIIAAQQAKQAIQSAQVNDNPQLFQQAQQQLEEAQQQLQEVQQSWFKPYS